MGRGPTAKLAPFFDPSWEIWGLAWVKYPREDKTFDIHEKEAYSNFTKADLQWHVDCAASKNIPIISADNGLYANPLPFPFEAIFEKFGRYFESSAAYLLAQAILENPDEIGLWGIHLETGTEWAEQKPNLEYLIGFGRGMGQNITVCPGAPLLISHWMAGRYGVNTKHRFK